MNIDKKVLIEAARHALKLSYSPYSKFKVGAAVLTESGEIVTGTNIENASYGLSICAERSAIFSAVSRGSSKILSVAIACEQSESKSNLMPCGACLQVISEFAKPNIQIYIDGVGDFELSDLLPSPFHLTRQ